MPLQPESGSESSSKEDSFCAEIDLPDEENAGY